MYILCVCGAYCYACVASAERRIQRTIRYVCSSRTPPALWRRCGGGSQLGNAPAS
ncbi:MAG: hypothetical protein ACI4IS_05070 [Acutalibacteraceae bacterium]